jgi:hypothetical protein
VRNTKFNSYWRWPSLFTVKIGLTARFEVFMALESQVVFFWVVTLSTDVAGYQHFGEPCCLNLEGADHITAWCHYPEDHNLKVLLVSLLVRSVLVLVTGYSKCSIGWLN